MTRRHHTRTRRPKEPGGDQLKQAPWFVSSTRFIGWLFAGRNRRPQWVILINEVVLR